VATFSQDSIGNVLGKWYQGSAPITMIVDAASRLVTMQNGAASTAYTYNAAGNQTLENLAGVQTGYVYDGENRLTKITNSDASLVTNAYQGDGLRRTTQQPGGKVSTMVWVGSDYLGQY
jgi:YD repeat-containing protein